MTLVLIVEFLLANNGKDRQYRFSPDEVEAANWLYTSAPPGSLLFGGTRNYPSLFRNYKSFLQVPISLELPETRTRIIADPAGILGRWLSEVSKGGFVILTKSQQAGIADLGIMPKGSFTRIDEALMGSPRFVVVKATANARIYALNPAAAHSGSWLQPPDTIEAGNPD